MKTKLCPKCGDDVFEDDEKFYCLSCQWNKMKSKPFKFIIEGEVWQFGGGKKGLKSALEFRLQERVRDAVGLKINKIRIGDQATK